MFGFPSFGKKQAPVSVPVVAAGKLVLVSQEDIYRPEQAGLQRDSKRQPILLLRKGQEIAAQDLPKLIQNGVRPDQVSFQYAESGTPFQLFDAVSKPIEKTDARVPAVSAQKLDAPVSIPVPPSINRATPPSHPPMGRHQQEVLILESDPKQMKRLIDCLFVCGFDLNRIHPLCISSHLSWALRRHQPDVLIADYKLFMAENREGALSPENTPARIIITTDANAAPLDRHQLQWPEHEDQIVQVLPKPISRFAMKRLLTPETTSPTRPLMIS
jgi:hypothetical protein